MELQPAASRVPGPAEGPDDERWRQQGVDDSDVPLGLQAAHQGHRYHVRCKHLCINFPSII